MSDGTIVDSYTAATKVVIGQAGGTATNIIVRTVSGGTSGEAKTVVGGGSAGNITVEGGKQTVVGGGGTGNSGGSAVQKVEGNNSGTTGNATNNGPAENKVETQSP